jgi:hypothetical protein
MEHVEPIPDDELKRLDALHAASQPGQWRWSENRQAWEDMLVESYPALRERLRLAEEESERLKAASAERTTMAARAQEAMRYLLNGLPANDAIWAAYGNADSARAWLADRDAKMKALGAAEYLEAAAEKRWTLSYTVMQAEAAALRERAR